ncbi:hypothetical protein EIP91_004906 [Steccherinum ochraceum]|uniref:Homoserine dehydrogenase n=1 Tax=Steccherinum ochraceum TaxID=92696 RepID=A0A4R0RGD2_9APHY|nr:hypothetical protein EIP91_004906 [Steccherinum ochraceum]
MAASSTSTTPRTIAVAVTGVGLVGSAFISQLLSVPKPNPFRLIALSSSKHTLFSPHGLEITSESWKPLLQTAPPKTASDLAKDLASLVSPAQAVVFVDNTSSEAIAGLYPTLLGTGVHVITPNKKAFSGDAGLYERIVRASGESGARFLNESTVGAGLPVVGTLKDLVATGDKIKKIEGVFSGTMSYIFNNFSTPQPGGPSFSSVVKIAREQGYTEPHPADDLTGSDVSRKLTILTRYIPSLKPSLPLPQGYLSVPTASLIPSQLQHLITPENLASSAAADTFVEELQKFDGEFDEMRSEALKEGKVLRYVGVVDVEKGEVKAELARYPVTHPFATSLGGSDNIVLFHTERYGARPLIVQGAGAGAEVTAMGVLGDLFRI